MNYFLNDLKIVFFIGRFPFCDSQHPSIADGGQQQQQNNGALGQRGHCSQADDQRCPKVRRAVNDSLVLPPFRGENNRDHSTKYMCSEVILFFPFKRS